MAEKTHDATRDSDSWDEDDDGDDETEPFPPSQMTLVCDILQMICKRCPGFAAEQRHMNAVIEAANLLHRELSQPRIEAKPDSGIQAWLASDDVGISSKFMAYTIGRAINLQGWMLARPSGLFEDEDTYPRDPADLNRCRKLLIAVPELSSHVGMELLGSQSPQWRAIVDHWDELIALLESEFPSGRAPKTYERMRELFALVEGRK